MTGPIPGELGRLANLGLLDLSRNDLTGRIPGTLGSLANLRVLDLSGNDLTGPHPGRHSGRLANLGLLDLSRNDLTGRIPGTLGSLANLRVLDLSWNDLTGPIPGELGRLANLDRLYLSENALTGSVPASLGSLASLRWLSLDINDLTGPVPAELGNLADLESLSLRLNPLSGNLPQGLTRLLRLRVLDISRTAACAPADATFQEWLETIDFRGETCNRPPEPVDTIPAQTLTASGPALGVSMEAYFSDPDEDPLTYLAASNHESAVTVFASGDTVWLVPGAAGTASVTVTASDPDGRSATQTMAVMTTDSAGPQSDREVLEVLYDSTRGADWTDSTNWKTSALLDEWYGVTTDTAGRVTRLYLRGNDLTGPIPGELGRLANLEGLSLRGNDLTGPVPASLGNLAQLRWLYLSGNDLTGRIPGTLGSLANLEWLDLRGNDLTGPVPASLGNLAQLRWLDLSGNDLTGPVPASLGNLAQLRWLDLSGNDLTGRIPGTLGSLANLEGLYLSWNDLTGPIPGELGRLANLERLILSGNDLTGRIPGTLGSLANLRVLYLIWNDLTGPIPGELGRLANLERLDLSGNDLTGRIPGTLGSLANLEWLYLSGNDLTGPIPGELGRLANLERLDLSYNWGLSGPLPPALQLPRLETLSILVTQACVPAGWRGVARGRPCESGTDVTVDVAVFYTPAAREKAGGAEAIAAVIDLMVAETNQAYAESGVHHRLALVGRSEVAYTETGVSRADLLRLANSSDDHMDEVHAGRDRVGADLVHLIADVNDVCGIAFILRSFGLTSYRCGGRTFAHELGHNMGLFHDRYNKEAGTSSHPAYGYVNQRAFAAGAARSSRWRTIMAYNNQCADVYDYCSPPLRFSNPRQTYNGDPLGAPFGAGGSGVTGPADASAVLNATGPALALWRHAPGVNRPPEAAGTLPDRALTLPGTLTVGVSTAFVDPDGDPLTYTVSSSAPDVVTLRAAGARLTLTAVGVGTATVRVTATDPGGLSAVQSFAVRVARPNRPPEAVGRLPDVVLPDVDATRELGLSGAFTDPDGDALSYAASSLAPGVVTVRALGARLTLTAVSEGAATVRVTATDPGGLSATLSFRVTVRVCVVERLGSVTAGRRGRRVVGQRLRVDEPAGQVRALLQLRDSGGRSDDQPGVLPGYVPVPTGRCGDGRQGRSLER